MRCADTIRWASHKGLTVRQLLHGQALVAGPGRVALRAARPPDYRGGWLAGLAGLARFI